MDMSQYMGLFISETREHLAAMSECILSLEKNVADRERIDTLFRLAHSIKGMAASMNFADLAALAHAMEDVMDGIRRGNSALFAAVADLLLEGVDKLQEMVEEVESGGTSSHDVTELLRRLKCVGTGNLDQSSQLMMQSASGPDPGDGGDESRCEIPIRRLQTGQSVRVRTETLDNLINITGELVTTRHRLAIISNELDSPRLEETVTELSKLLRELHSEVLKVRLMPFAAIAGGFPRVVRDLSSKIGKQVTFEIIGKEVEVDRGILEELADPLLHMLRNAVDHGVESPAERIAAGKGVAGTIRLAVRREKDQLVLRLSDDGRGMDSAELVASAVERKLITAEEATLISPRQAFMLTCLPGFSMADKVSPISGRGVGMDVVRSSVQALGGSLSIDSSVGRGTTITVTAPLSLAIIPVLLVSCSSLTVGFPVSKVQRTLELKRSQITTEGKRKVFLLDGHSIPLLSLNRVLGLPISSVPAYGVPTIVTEFRGEKVGLVVDRFEAHQEVFLKPLGRPLSELTGAAGAAILGDGRVVVILDTTALLEVVASSKGRRRNRNRLPLDLPSL